MLNIIQPDGECELPFIASAGLKSPAIDLEPGTIEILIADRDEQAFAYITEEFPLALLALEGETLLFGWPDDSEQYARDLLIHAQATLSWGSSGAAATLCRAYGIPRPRYYAGRNENRRVTVTARDHEAENTATLSRNRPAAMIAAQPGGGFVIYSLDAREHAKYSLDLAFEILSGWSDEDRRRFYAAHRISKAPAYLS